jgi:hypothetical protein
MEEVFQKEWQLNFSSFGPPKKSNSHVQVINTMIEMMRHYADAAIFLEPVDPTVYPTYYKKIRQPIDLQAMQNKNDNEGYQSLADFEADMNLMFRNCYTFNAKKTVGYELGASSERFFKKEWKLLTKQKGESIDLVKQAKLDAELALILEALSAAQEHSCALPFLEPVPRTVPNYHQMIQKPMDLGTVQKKILLKKYKTVEDCISDVQLIFTNCHTFNGEVITHYFFIRIGLRILQTGYYARIGV